MAAALSLTDTVRASAHQVSSHLGEDTVILELDQGVYFGLEPVGTRIWELLAEPRQIAQIRDQILTEYEVEPERATTDLLALLQQMIERGLVEVDAKAP